VFKIVIETIPYDQMRYPTPGDYYWSHDGSLIIQVADLGNWRYEYLTALRQAQEVIRCRHRGIHLKEIEDWDLAFERDRVPGDFRNPGEVDGCPYGKEYREAINSEKIAAQELGVDWNEYQEAVNKLVWPQDRPIDSRRHRKVPNGENNG
jgi:hypothetical protein